MRRLYDIKPLATLSRPLYPEPFEMRPNCKTLASYKKTGIDMVEMSARLALNLIYIKSLNKPVKILKKSVLSEERYKRSAAAYGIHMQNNYFCFNGSKSLPLEEYAEMDPVYIFKTNKTAVRDLLRSGTDVKFTQVEIGSMWLPDLIDIIRHGFLHAFKMVIRGSVYYGPPLVVLSQTTLNLTSYSAALSATSSPGSKHIFADLTITTPIGKDI